MAPILGIWASSIQPSLNAGSFESITTTTVGSGGASYVEFTSIPATYTHLQIRGMARTGQTGDYSYLNMRVGNGSVDTGSNYATHYLSGNGTSASAAALTSQTSMRVGSILCTAEMTSGVFTNVVIDILDYANTNKYKTTRSLNGHDNNGVGPISDSQKGYISLNSGLWQSTSAINTIRLYDNGNNNLVQYSSFALYGIKGA